MTNEKYALLDTDFISKMHLIKKDDENHLIDRILEMSGYQFYCHEQIKTELRRHNVSGVIEWLEDKISLNNIHCYSDEDILNELLKIYGKSSSAMYVQLLRNACDAFSAGYFTEKFCEIQKIDYVGAECSEFLEALKLDERTIGQGQNLGEIKTYVLLQVLSLKYGERIYVFCSDDRNARSGVISFKDARCISVLTSFIRLQKESGLQRIDVEPYIQSFLQFCYNSKQTQFRVYDNSERKRICKVDCKQVIDDIYDGKFIELLTGDLKYI